MEKQFVTDLQDKDLVQSFFLLKERVVHTGKNGKPYMTILLCDRTGEVDGRVWDNVDELSQAYAAGDVVKVKGVVQIFQNRKQVVVHRMERAVDGEVKSEHLIPQSLLDTAALQQKLANYVSSIQDPFIRELIERGLAHEDVKSKLSQAPAAKTIHHAYRGGLLEHIVSICGVMDFVGQHYPFMNRDLLIFGAIFHDLGKIWELQFETATSYTDAGRMMGHLVMSVEFIEKLSQQIPKFPEELKNNLKHIVLSHHGKLEYGSPKLPQFLEAYVVAAIDDFDSKINTIHSFIQSEKQTGQKWSRYNQMFDRYFYLGIGPTQAYSKEHLPETSPPSLSIPQNHDGLTYKK